MEKILRSIGHDFTKNESFREEYLRMMQTEGWKVHLGMLKSISDSMAKEMLTPKFTELGAEEKDLRQRTYAGVVAMIQFLMNPLRYFTQNVKIINYNNKIRDNQKGEAK